MLVVGVSNVLGLLASGPGLTSRSDDELPFQEEEEAPTAEPPPPPPLQPQPQPLPQPQPPAVSSAQLASVLSTTFQPPGGSCAAHTPSHCGL